MNKLRFLLVLAATALVLASLGLPLWHMRLESPQYQGSEALKIAVYPGALRGDLNELRVLNRYIGVHFPERLPQVHWLPAALLAGAGVGLVGLMLRRRIQGLLWAMVAGWFVVALGSSAALAQWQMYRFGHDRNPHAPLRLVKDFTPPLLGTAQIENFHVTSGLGAGAYLDGTVICVYLVAAWARWKPRVQDNRAGNSVVEAPPLLLASGR